MNNYLSGLSQEVLFTNDKVLYSCGNQFISATDFKDKEIVEMELVMQQVVK